MLRESRRCTVRSMSVSSDAHTRSSSTLDSATCWWSPTRHSTCSSTVTSVSTSVGPCEGLRRVISVRCSATASTLAERRSAAPRPGLRRQEAVVSKRSSWPSVVSRYRRPLAERATSRPL